MFKAKRNVIWPHLHNYCQMPSKMGIHLIKKRLSSELLHCALRIVSYSDPGPRPQRTMDVTSMPRLHSIVLHIASMANTRMLLSHNRHVPAMLFKNSLHPWCVAVWVCNNAQCTMQQFRRQPFFELGVYLGRNSSDFICSV